MSGHARRSAEPIAVETPDRLGLEAAVFLRQLGRCRRRLQWVELCRLAVVVGAAAIVVVQLVSIVTPETLAIQPAAIAVLGGAAALVLARAWRARPTLLRTATALDVRTGADNELATALQFAGADDPAARIVQRRASARLAALDPRVALPLEAPTHARFLLAAVLIASMVWALDRSTSSARWPLVGGAVVMSGGAAQRPAAPRERDASAPEYRADSTPAAAQLAAGPADARSTAAAMSSPAMDRLSAQATSAESAVSRHSSEPTTSGGDGSSSAEGLASDGEAASAGGRRSAANAPGDPGGTRPPARGAGKGAGGGGSVADADAGAVEGAGGVTYSNLAKPPGRLAYTAGPTTAEYAARYRSARQRADLAVKQERIAPHLRVHVREYFAIIRPAGMP